MAENLELLKQRFPLLDYLRQSNWAARRLGATAEFVGLCPFHRETRPSFFVNGRKNLFYCHGCGRGGDLIRFIQLSQGLSFRQTVAYLQQQIAPLAPGDVLEQAAAFYQLQLHSPLRMPVRRVSVALRLDCLHQIGPNQWALHVPIGKLHTERFVPADLRIRQTVARILALRALASPARLARSEGLLLPRFRSHHAVYQALSRALADNAQRAGCSGPVSLHRLRHTFASEMIRLGVGLPALMQLLGHNDIRMTLRYVQVTQPDLQREFHSARHRVHPTHQVPALSVPTSLHNAGLPGIHQALTATRHLLEMYRRSLADEKARRRLQRLNHRLLDIAAQLDNIAEAGK